MHNRESNADLREHSRVGSRGEAKEGEESSDVLGLVDRGSAGEAPAVPRRERQARLCVPCRKNKKKQIQEETKNPPPPGARTTAGPGRAGKRWDTYPGGGTGSEFRFAVVLSKTRNTFR